MNTHRRTRLQRLRRHARRARRVRARAGRCSRAGATAPTRQLARRAAGGARLRDGARAAGLPAGLQSRSATRPLGARRCSRAPRRCRPTSASGCTSPRIAAALADDDYERAQDAPRRVAAPLSARCARAAGRRMRSTTSPATSRACTSASRAVLPAWSSDLPGYHAVLAMHAFGLEESGEYERGRGERPRSAGADPVDARAHHVMAHVFEMTERADAGVALDERARRRPGPIGTVVATIAGGTWRCSICSRTALDRALAFYDGAGARRRRRDRRPDRCDRAAVAHPSCAAATPARAGASSPRPGRRTSTTRFCSFNDLHAMLAFVGARDWRARRASRACAGARRASSRRATAKPRGCSACRLPRADGVRPRRRPRSRSRCWRACRRWRIASAAVTRSATCCT